ncbi:GNAT family N-acetyltransferase [Burkholderia sp. HI2761]|uniref:arsenic resistance N-acetyltransferase ArsN2 n=1 Tax=Burkholderia TaxID=32008 RepID=UPI000417A588|nr:MULTISPECIES: arsenic resistance N-acetyltransferase ArsN2 [Burkholderia]MPV55399.1 GNAT family N-acetyltransferase [Burkholderia sp. BE24]OXJ27786.1 GNAT family N-acetyltransferase [Burkholderia sp. HI2761]
MEIRCAAVDDLPSIEALLRENALPADGVASHVQRFVVAIEHSTICGCGGIEYYGDVALLRSVAVAAHVRDAGVGRVIVSRLVDACLSRNVRSLVLLTTTAESYFARLGFVRVARGDVPSAVLASPQFQGVCPESAVSMLRVL